MRSAGRISHILISYRCSRSYHQQLTSANGGIYLCSYVHTHHKHVQVQISEHRIQTKDHKRQIDVQEPRTIIILIR